MTIEIYDINTNRYYTTYANVQEILFTWNGSFLVMQKANEKCSEILQRSMLIHEFDCTKFAFRMVK